MRPGGSDVRRALAVATRALAEAGIPSPRYDAEELAAHVAGVDRAALWRLDGLDAEAYVAAVARRAAREPLQHITGRAYFRHVTLAVGPGVFVPRPETELVAGAAVAEARALLATGRPARVVDLCTGSGAIAVAVATEVPDALVHAVELDPAAQAWAQRNCAGHGIDLRLGDAAAAFPELDGTVDVVVSNPPYIPLTAEPLEPEVAAYDPPLALWSGPDGLDALRAVAGAAARLLRAGGLLAVEHADVQGATAPGVLRAAGGWTDVADHADLAGRARYLTARRACLR